MCTYMHGDSFCLHGKNKKVDKVKSGARPKQANKIVNPNE